MTESLCQKVVKLNDNFRHSDTQYRNLNLNEQCKPYKKDLNFHDEMKSSVNTTSNNYSNKYNSGVNCNNGSSNSQIGKKILFSKPSKFINHDEKDEVINWKNKGGNINNSSTLSLHISCYESNNPPDYGNDVQKNKLKQQKIKCRKKWFMNTVNDQPKKNLFEFPRQQTPGTTTPEVMQFKASQKLLNPSATASPLQQPCPTQDEPVLPPPHPFFQPRIRSLNVATVAQRPIVVTKDMARHQNIRHQLMNHKKPKLIQQFVKQPSSSTNASNVSKLKMGYGNEKGKTTLPMRDTKRKEGWDDKNVIKMIDDFIMIKKPAQMSELVKLLIPYFGTLGRTTVVTRVNKRKKELNFAATSKPNKIIPFLDSKEKRAPLQSPQKPTLAEVSAVEIDKTCKPQPHEPHDPFILLDEQIINVEHLLKLPQTTVQAAALEGLHKKLIEAKIEYKAALEKKKVDFLEREYDIDLSFDVPDAPPVFRKPRGKKLIKNYYFGLNEKLDRRMLIVAEGKDNVREFTIETSRGQTTYFTCRRCRNSGFKKCRAILFPNGEVYMDVHHHKLCGPVPKLMSDAWQGQRIASTEAAKGTKSKLAFDEGFKNALANKAQSAYGNYTTRLNNISRWRGKFIPDCFKGNLQQHYKKLYNLDERWILDDSGDTVVFATDEQLIAMAEATVLAVDSTFSITPMGFKQTFFCHALIESEQGEHWVVTVMALMNNKEESSYDHVFNCIKKRWEEMGITPQFERIHADYEVAQSNALKKAFGEEFIKGCLFHYDQCLLRRVSELGLFPYYVQKKAGKKLSESHRRIRTWVRSLMALPLLPKDDCQEFSKILCKPPPKPENVPDQQWPTVALQELADYMEKEWLSKTDNMWNFNNLRRVRNSNRCEGFHSAMSKMFEKNPKLKIFMKDMQLYFTQVQAEIEGIRQNRQRAYRNKKYAMMDEQLLHYEEQFRIDMEEATTNLQKNFIRFRHCRRVSHLLHEIRNKSCNTIKSEKKAYKGETPATWKKDLQYIFDRDDSEIEEMFWIMEEEEDAMINRGEMEDDLESILEETFSFDNIPTDEAELSVLLANPPFAPPVIPNPSTSSTNKYVNNNNNLIHFPKPPMPKNITPVAFEKDDPPSSPIMEHYIDPTVVQASANDVISISDDTSSLASNTEEAASENSEVQWLPNPPPNARVLIPIDAITLDQLQFPINAMRLQNEWAEESPYLYYHAGPDLPHIFPYPTEDVDGDGNCGFRAISKALTGSEIFHWDLRILATETLATTSFDGVGPDAKQTYLNFLPELMDLDRDGQLKKKFLKIIIFLYDYSIFGPE